MSQRELRQVRRMAMYGVPERLGMSFSGGGFEMRARPSGTGGSAFEFDGYATVYNAPFPMWDQAGDPFTEVVAPGAARRSLNNPNLDVPFLIGHDDSGIPMARTKSGTMKLSEDSRGVHVHVPAMDGRREDVRALASAVERGDMSEMSLAFICNRQEWDNAYEQRTILEMDLHRGDVCAVVHGANPATDGSWMAPIEQLSFRRPAAIGGPVLLEHRASAMHNGWVRRDGKWVFDPENDGDDDSSPETDTDHDYWSADGKQLKAIPPDPDGKHGKPLPEPRASVQLLELLSVNQAERDRAKAAGNSLPDGSYPINNVAQLHSAAVLAASHHGDWQAARALIRRRAKELGVDVTSLPGFGEEHAAGLPLEHRASAADDFNLSLEPDYNAEGVAHPMQGTHVHAHTDGQGGEHTHAHAHDGDGVHTGAGHSATVMVDDGTGIPGEEMQMSAARRLELRLREVDMAELASQR